MQRSPTFVQSIGSDRLFNKTVQDLQAVDASRIQGLKTANFATYHFDVFRASTEFEKHEVKVLSRSQ